MIETAINISKATSKDYPSIGKLMVEVYSNLEGFATPEEQPEYYEMLANVGSFAKNKHVDILMAKRQNELLGAVIYIGDLNDYGALVDISKEINAAAFRLLAVSTKARGLGVGKLLTRACMDKARASGLGQMIIHTTESMKVAWGMYEKMGFERSGDLDFIQRGLPVYGFRIKL